MEFHFQPARLTVNKVILLQITTINYGQNTNKQTDAFPSGLRPLESEKKNQAHFEGVSVFGDYDRMR